MGTIWISKSDLSGFSIDEFRLDVIKIHRPFRNPSMGHNLELTLDIGIFLEVSSYSLISFEKLWTWKTKTWSIGILGERIRRTPTWTGDMRLYKLVQSLLFSFLKNRNSSRNKSPTPYAKYENKIPPGSVNQRGYAAVSSPIPRNTPRPITRIVLPIMIFEITLDITDFPVFAND